MMSQLKEAGLDDMRDHIDKSKKPSLYRVKVFVSYKNVR